MGRPWSWAPWAKPCRGDEPRRSLRAPVADPAGTRERAGAAYRLDPGRRRSYSRYRPFRQRRPSRSICEPTAGGGPDGAWRPGRRGRRDPRSGSTSPTLAGPAGGAALDPKAAFDAAEPRHRGCSSRDSPHRLGRSPALRQPPSCDHQGRRNFDRLDATPRRTPALGAGNCRERNSRGRIGVVFLWTLRVRGHAGASRDAVGMSQGAGTLGAQRSGFER